MHTAQRIRKLVAEHFNRCGADSTARLEETLLIRDGFYCGRRYRLDGWQAVWFVEENQIKVYDQEGVLVLSQDDALLCEQLRAA